MKNITNFKKKIIMKGKKDEILRLTLKIRENEFCFNPLFVVQF